MSEIELTLEEKIAAAKDSVRWGEEWIRDGEVNKQFDEAKLRVMEIKATKKRFAIADQAHSLKEAKLDLVGKLSKLEELEKELAGGKEGE